MFVFILIYTKSEQDCKKVTLKWINLEQLSDKLRSCQKNAWEKFYKQYKSFGPTFQVCLVQIWMVLKK